MDEQEFAMGGAVVNLPTFTASVSSVSPTVTLAGYMAWAQATAAAGGYCDGNLSALLVADKATSRLATSLGVLDEQEKERLVGPIFPVDTVDGRRVTLWACQKDGTSRFLFTRPVPLWNAVAAKQSTTLFVFKDPIEALSVAAAGHSNVTALDPELGEPDHKAIRGWGVQGLTVVVADTPARHR